MAEFVDGFVDILKQQNSIKEEEQKSLKQDFKDRSKESFIYFLLDEGIVPKEEILNALSKYFNVPSFDVNGYLFQHNLVSAFPQDFLTSAGVIPLEEDNDILIVIASEPDTPGLESRVREYTDSDVEFYVGIKRDIWDAIREFSQDPVNEEEVEQEEDEFIQDNSSIVDDFE